MGRFAMTIRPSIATPSALVVDLAALLAMAYLRLTKGAHNLGTSGPSAPQKELDVSCPESPHLLREIDTGDHRGEDRAR